MAGAGAVVISNYVTEPSFALGTLGEVAPIPVLSVSHQLGSILAFKAGPVGRIMDPVCVA